MTSTITKRWSSTRFEREFKIQYFEKPESEHNEYIGIQKLKEIVGDLFTATRILDKIQRSRDQEIEIKLRRGIRFKFISI